MELQELLHIRATIIDKGALAKITPAMLETYLRRKSFAVYEYAGFHPREALWTLTDEQRPDCPVWVPLVAEAGDYVLRVSELLSELAGFENRSQLAIYVDILEGA